MSGFQLKLCKQVNNILDTHIKFILLKLLIIKVMIVLYSLTFMTYLRGAIEVYAAGCRESQKQEQCVILQCTNTHFYGCDLLLENTILQYSSLSDIATYVNAWP